MRTARAEPLWYDKNGDPSDSYASEQGRSNSDAEKSVKKDGSRESDAVKWSQYCREREASDASASEASPQGRPRPSSDAALPPPDILVDGRRMMG